MTLLQKTVNLDQLSEKKRFCWKKNMLHSLEKSRRVDKKKRLKAFL